jgi:hypothetical protein
MKKFIVAISLITLAGFASQAQATNTGKTVQASISIKLKNNSLLPSKVTMISYRPDETGNSTRGFMMGPYSSKTFSFPVGTKIYLANSTQVNTVMSGASITGQVPFIVVKPADADKTFTIKQ